MKQNKQLKLLHKRYFMIDQQIARKLVYYSECLSNPPSLLSNSNNFRVGSLANRKILLLLNIPLV